MIEGKTVIVVAHRLQTVSDADKIIVLDNGEAVEQGRHKELLGMDGLYTRLWDVQEKARGWTISA